MQKLALLPWMALLAFGCSDRTTGTSSQKPDEPTGPAHVASTRGGAIVLSRDERVAVATNRSAGIVTVLHLDPTRGPADLVDASRTFSLDAGQGSEPWAAVIGADDDTAYVVLRGRGVVQKVTGLHGDAPRVAATAAVGAEPTAIAISPMGRYLFVANWGDGTVSSLDTENVELAELPGRFDLNTKLAESSTLGAVVSRPGLAHPRALAMTDNGDDNEGDETLYVTEFFSQPLPIIADTPDASHVDRNRQGLVYAVPVSGRDFAHAPVSRLRPVADTGFADAAGAATGCFPNQLYAAAVDGTRLVVTAMCASPRGPVGPKAADGTATPKNFQTAVHPALFGLELQAGRPEERRPVALTQALDELYATDDPASPKRMPLIPNDIAFEREPRANGVRSAYVTAFGADALFRLDFAADGALSGVGAPNARFVDLRKGTRGGTLPIGVALSTSAAAPFALVLNDNTQNVSVIDRATDHIAAVYETTDQSDGSRAHQVLLAPENHGRRLFATGLDAWSLQGQAWNSCESCHPDGLSDGVTWFFTRGPRRTISTAGTYDGEDPPRRRFLLWTANIDEVHDVEVIARTVSGGVGGMLWRYATPPAADCRILYDGSSCAATSPAGTCMLTGAGGEPCPAPKHTSTLRNGLNGSLVDIATGGACEREAESCDESNVEDWNDIDAYIRSVRTPEGPAISELSITAVDRGLALFREGRCAGCHGGSGFTISKLFYTPGSAANGALPYVPPATGVPDLIGELRRTTYAVPPELLLLNPPGKEGNAFLRSWAPADGTDMAASTLAYSNPPGDQINCVLRSVGTFPVQPVADTANPTPAPNTTGIVAPGAPSVLEVRQDMTTLALGGTGFNIPSLLGLAAGAPYFHAGNARTLEEVFDPVFAQHHQALAQGFLSDSTTRADDVRALVSYLLSLDERTYVEPVPNDLPYDPVLCPHD